MSASKLKKTIEQLANQFAADLLRALGDASFAELSAELQGGGGVRAVAREERGGGRGRSGSGDVAQAIERIVSTLRSAGAGGLRSEELRRRVGLARAEMMRPIALALAAKKIRKSGQRRATTYYAR